MRVLLPRLSSHYAEEASLTFQDRYLDARRSSRWQGLRLVTREVAAGITTAFSEWRSAWSGQRIVFSRLILKHEGAPRDQLPPEAPAPGRFLEALISDFRLAARNLRRTPVFATVSVLLLAIGMGATIFFFTGLNATFFRPPMHITAADDLIYIYRVDPFGRASRISWPDYQDIRQQLDDLASLAVFGYADPVVERASGLAERVRAEQVSPDYFSVLGVPLILGRDFVEEDLSSGVEPVVIGYRLWREEYGRSTSALGKVLRVDGRDRVVVGVAPRGLRIFGALSQADLWTLVKPELRQQRGYSAFRPVGRLKEGIGIGQIQERCTAVATGLAESFPEHWNDRLEQPRTVNVLSEKETRFNPEYGSNPLFEFLVILLLLLLLSAVPCANVGNLLLARGLRRGREIAVRLSLGARRSRLVRMLLTESLLLAGLAAALSIALLIVARHLAVVGVGPFHLPAEFDNPIDIRVILFSILVAGLTVVMFGLPPARHASRANLVTALKGQINGTRVGGSKLRNLFVVAQVACSLTLVVAGALALRSYQEMRSLDLGFNAENVSILHIDLSLGDYEEAMGRQFFDNVSSRARAMPQVESVALGYTSLMGASSVAYGGVVPIDLELSQDHQESAEANFISPGYFELHRIPCVRGRDFSADDSGGSPRVVIVNETYARQYWPDADPIGKWIRIVGEAEIVGVVRDSQYNGISEISYPHVWLPLSQHYQSSLFVNIRSVGDPQPIIMAVRQEIRSMDASLPILEAVMLEELVDRRMGSGRSMMRVMNGIGLVTLLLAMFGLYGVVAFTVGQRRRELGVRIALGARSTDVIRLILLQGFRLSGKGVLFGLPLVLITIPLLRSELFGLVSLDPLAVGGAALLLMLTAVLSSLPAAIRATRVDPVSSMRSE
jgi:predicted permease